MRRGLFIGRGHWLFLLRSPIAVGLYTAALLFLVLVSTTFKAKNPR